MNATNFCYWLQGYCEICDNTPNAKQWEIIKDHLKIVEDAVVVGIKPTAKYKEVSIC